MALAKLLAFAACASAMQSCARIAPAPGAPVDGVFTDASVIAANPDLVTRTGKTLRFRNGTTLTDEGDCSKGDCVEYRVDGAWHKRFVGVDETHYEGGGYIVVNLGMNNSLVRTGSRPVPSPNGKLFFAGYHDDVELTPNHGAAIWEFDESGPSRLRLVETYQLMFDSFVAWRGSSCVEFTGARGYGRGMKPIRSYWLAEDQGDWRLLESPASTCKANSPP